MGISGKCNISRVAELFPSYSLADHCHGVKQEIFSSRNAALGAQLVSVWSHLAGIQSPGQHMAGSRNRNILYLYRHFSTRYFHTKEGQGITAG